jgi:hypothetical protein
MASMRNWLHGKEGRVVVVHCKAGKGRSGTASCSYLMSEEGWPMEKALQRFTERRMRPGMGYKGVSIPSQLRWLEYVDKWTKHGKTYVERQVEIMEVHCWGLRDGVKIQIEGFVEDGKLIKNFYTFTEKDREVIRGEVKTTGMAQAVHEVMYKNGLSGTSGRPSEAKKGDSKNASRSSLEAPENTDAPTVSRDISKESLLPGTGDVVFRPSRRVVLPTNDINIDVERRNKAAFDLTMVTAVAHVWFNAFFEGNGPEKNGKPDNSGVFEIAWDAMDGIKGSSRKGTQAFERIAVVWRALSEDEGRPGVVINEPKEGEEVHQSGPADWKGTKGVEPSEGKDLGLRTSSPNDSDVNVNVTSSVRDENAKNRTVVKMPGRRDSDDSSTKDVRSDAAPGQETLKETIARNAGEATGGSNGSGSGSEAMASQPVLSAEPERSGLASEAPAQETKPHEKGHDMEGAVQNPTFHVSGAVSTNDLPDGRPEGDMETAKQHGLGHLSRG